MLEAFKNRKKLEKKKAKPKEKEFKKAEADTSEKLHSKPKMRIVIGFDGGEDDD